MKMLKLKKPVKILISIFLTAVLISVPFVIKNMNTLRVDSSKKTYSTQQSAARKKAAVTKRKSEKTKAVKASDSKPDQQQISPQPAVKPVYKGQKLAYLTFDDGPSKNTPALLDILKKEDIKATFFITFLSSDSSQKRAWIKREAQEGHTLGIHSWSHDYKYIYSSENNFIEDFDKMRDVIKSSTGVDPKFVRFPGGTDNTVSIKYNGGKLIMPELLDYITKKGYIDVDWNVGGMDAVKHIPSTATLVREITAECSHLKIAVILLHDSAPHISSVEAVPQIVKNLKAMGFEFEPLTSADEAVRHKPASKR